MTVNPGTGAGVDGSADSPPLSQNTIARLARAYMATYHGPHGDAPGADSAVTGPVDRAAVGMLVSPPLIDAHYRLGRHRSIGDGAVRGADQWSRRLDPATRVLPAVHAVATSGGQRPRLVDVVADPWSVRGAQRRQCRAIRCIGAG